MTQLKSSEELKKEADDIAQEIAQLRAEKVKLDKRINHLLGLHDIKRRELEHARRQEREVRPI